MRCLLIEVNRKTKRFDVIEKEGFKFVTSFLSLQDATKYVLLTELVEEHN